MRPGASILVTGGRGIIGTNVVQDMVARGGHPVVVDVKTGDFIETLAGRVDFHRLDISDFGATLDLFQTYNFSTVLHLAALTDPRLDEEPMISFQANMAGTVHVLEAARRTGVRRVLMASTKNVYPEMAGPPHGPPTNTPVPEEHPLDPGRPYAIWKYAAERLGRFYRERFGLEFAAFRFATYYAAERIGKSGHRAIDLLHTIMRNAIQGVPTYVASGGQRLMDCVYVRDLSFALTIAAGANELPSPVYNVGSGDPMTPLRFAAAVKLAVPDAVIEIGPGPEFAPGHYIVLDIRRAQRDFGYQSKWPLELSVPDCIQRGRKILQPSGM